MVYMRIMEIFCHLNFATELAGIVASCNELNIDRGAPDYFGGISFLSVPEE